MSDDPPRPPPGPGGDDATRPDDGAPEPGPPPPPPEALSPAGRTGTGWWAKAAGAVLLVLLVASVVVGVRNGLQPAGRSTPLGEVAPGAAVPDPLTRSEVAQRQEAAGCDLVVDRDPLANRDHLDPATAPPPAALYPDRPAHSGRHHGRLLALPDDTPEAPIDERAVLHNMEHGSVVVWFAPGEGRRREVAAWRASRARLGFTSPRGGAVFASPVPADVEQPPTVALRAWGVAMDCERFDPVVADAFLVEHWGSHGIAPEASLSPYPEGSLRWAETV